MSALPYTNSVSPAGMFSFLEMIKPDLEAVEEKMHAEIGSDVRTISDLTGRLINAGGKRLRPAMVSLAARATGAQVDRGRIATVGAAVEFVHMATLVHDDVVDDTSHRRGMPTANSIYGNGAAVLSGDYVLARAMRLLAIDGDLRIIRTVSEITIAMSEGEVMEIGATGCSELSIPEYFEILRKKTAVFVEGCCRVGAMLASASSEVEEALGNYGYNLGMAFQIADDLLDYTGNPAVTGKPRGSDLKDGRATLPLLIALQDAPSSERSMLLAAFNNSSLDERNVDAVCNLLEGHNAFQRTMMLAEEFVECAHKSLSVLPSSSAKDCFNLLTEYVIRRNM